MNDQEATSLEIQAQLESLWVQRKVELAQELAAQADLIAQRAEIIKNTDPKIFRKEAEEIYNEYSRSNVLGLTHQQKYETTSSYVENCVISVEIQNNQVTLGYFDNQVRISYWPGLDQEQSQLALAEIESSNPQVIRYSMINYSADMVNDPTSPTIRTI